MLFLLYPTLYKFLTPSVILNILTYVVRVQLLICNEIILFGHLKPTGHVMHQQFNIQQLYALPTLYLCVLYLSENKQRLVPLTA